MVVNGSKQDEEVSLIEMLATVIRRRRWVYTTTAFGFVAVFLLLYVLPWAGIKLIGQTSLTLEVNLRTVNLSPDAQQAVNFDIPALVKSQLMSLGEVGAIYRQTLASPTDLELDKAGFNRVVKRFISKNLKVTQDSRSETLTVILNTSETSKADGNRFLRLLTDQLQQDTRGYVLPLLETAIANLDNLKTVNTESGMQAQVQYEVRAKALRALLSNPDFPLRVVGEVDEIDDDAGASRSLILILSLLVFGFLGLILAFVVDAIHKTRQDPEVVNLLKDAWKGK